MSKIKKTPLFGGMQDFPLTVDNFINHAARWHGDREVVSQLVKGQVVRSDWKTLRAEAMRLSNALLADDIKPGDRVATMSMNSGKHLACWYGIMGVSAVCHTLNPRLSDSQLVYIINHAADRIIFADSSFESLLTRILPLCSCVEKVVYIDDEKGSWEDFLNEHPAHHDWCDIDERAAAGLCYTSGTTGNPKGVLYSHRSNYLHTLMILQPDIFNLGSEDVVLPVVPMFHANAWGLTFAAAAVGAKLVLPGLHVDGQSLYELIESEGVTFTAAVPTVWQGLLDYIESNDLYFSTLKEIMVGGAACSEALFLAFRKRGVEVQHNWGMTETSPLGTSSSSSAVMASLPEAEQLTLRLKQGRVPIGVDMRIVNEEGGSLARDGQTNGYLQVKGHSVVSRYYRADEDSLDGEGFFDTGDVATIDGAGYMSIMDRAKDVIKSGGEWISSVAIENSVLDHPAVSLAAVIGVPHPKWDERPLLLVQTHEDSEVSVEELQSLLLKKLAKWEVPDVVLFVDDIPLGATGKIDKKVLRERYTDWTWSD